MELSNIDDETWAARHNQRSQYDNCGHVNIVESNVFLLRVQYILDVQRSCLQYDG